MRARKAPATSSDALEVSGIRQRNVQTFFVAPQRQKLISHHQVNRYLIEDRIVDRRILVSRQ